MVTNPTETPEDRNQRLEIYKLMVEMADRVSQRRQAANNFYLSVNTLLIGSSAYLGALHSKAFGIFIVSIAGIAICSLWIRNITSYKTLNAAKFKVINAIEAKLAEQPFSEEWCILDPDGDGNRHRPFHQVEVVVPWVFLAAYLLQIFAALPWSDLYHLFCG